MKYFSAKNDRKKPMEFATASGLIARRKASIAHPESLRN